MVRAPCCEKMGLKKGPWTAEEDEILVSHIQRFGHSNWRALPKQAGLLRCGKSCRLRWINYLRPDIKRGNFTTEEEDAIINLHQMLGNRWSAIAAKLPGRTDNEIKNVWHTHLKKRLLPKPKPKDHDHHNSNNLIQIKAKSINRKQSPAQSASEFSSSVTDQSSTSSEENIVDSYGTSNLVKHESFSSEESEFPIIDESFWSEDLTSSSMDHNGNEFNDHVKLAPVAVDTSNYGVLFSELDAMFGSSNADDMDFWLRVFMEAGDMKELPQL